MFWRRATGRSDIVAKNGMVASSQPLATQAGLDILKKGGNAIDAAIAAAAVLDVVEPFSTGCGGDAFALIHLPNSKTPISFNGSGRSGSLATIENHLTKGWTEMPVRGGASVTVPGAMHLWGSLVDSHGSLEFSEVLKPAISYARDGFPVSPVISEVWGLIASVLQNDEAKKIYTINGRHPQIGETMRNPDLAKVFETVARDGYDTFYNGEIAEAIVSTVQEHGGFLATEDLASHKTMSTEPISTSYRGMEVFEHPPNGQGFAALSMLNIMEEFDIGSFPSLSANRYHVMIEAKKLAYLDLYAHCADPEHMRVSMKELLSKSYAKKRRSLLDMKKADDSPVTGFPLGEDTIYLCTADSEGRAVSFINSLFMGFGSGLVVPGHGIKLQNRGNLFSLDPDHPNSYAPRKLPFHTIIPGALYKDKKLFGVFGIMGGSHQAQAHAQFVSNVVDYGMAPQAALDFPRFNHTQKANTVGIENDVPADVQGELRKRGHKIVHETMTGFGGGQAIFQIDDAWISGSDFRKDGQAAGF